MDNRDREAIEDLFRRIGEVERQSGPRDREAAALIRTLSANQPSAPYYMAQTIIVQQQALDAAQARLDEMENRGAEPASGGGFLDNIFGAGARQRPAPRTGARAYEERGPWGSGRRTGNSMGGGGFLAGAAQTAMGVAGGVVLGNMLANYLTPDQAGAAGAGDQEAGGADIADTGGAADTQIADAGDFGGGDFDIGDF